MMTSQVTRKLEARALLERAVDPCRQPRPAAAADGGRAGRCGSSAQWMLKPRMRTTLPPWVDSAMGSYWHLGRLKNLPLDDHTRSAGSVPPLEHPERAEGVPAARRAHAALKIEVDLTRMDPVEQPAAVGLPLRLHDFHCLRHPGIRVRARPPEVVERAQHVVVPVVRKSEVEIRRLDDLAGALAAEQAAFEQVLLAAAPGLRAPADPPVARSNSSRPSSTLMVVSNEDRTDPFSTSQFQPPSEPLSEDPLDDRLDAHSEVGPGLDRYAVDARLNLAIEVPLPGVLPAPVLRDKHDRRRAASTPGRARGVAGSAAYASSPSTAGLVPAPDRRPGSRRRRPRARPDPGARGDARPSRRARLGFARQRHRRPTRSSDPASPASGWRDRPRAANQACSPSQAIPVIIGGHP